MQCVYRSYDHTDAQIVTGLLVSEGCHAHLFENGLSRLRWHQAIAYGGARVMVVDEDLPAAIDVLARWQLGEYQLGEGDLCPRCNSTSIEENPNYRGWAFFFGCFLGLPIWPMRKWHERCNSCSHHWKAIPPDTYAELKVTIAEERKRMPPWWPFRFGR